MSPVIPNGPASALRPRDATVLATADAALKAGRWADAANAYQKVLAVQPAHAWATHGYGLAMLKLGQPMIGIAMLQRAVAAEPSNPRFGFTLAQALARSDPAQARALLARAAEAAPDDAEIVLAQAQALHEQGRAAAALTLVERLCAGAGAASQAACRFEVELCYETDALEQAEARQHALLERWPALARDYRIGHAVPDAVTPPGAPLPHDLASAAAFAAEASLHVVDDFLGDPAAYRAAALALPFHAVQYAEQNFPGVQTDGQPCDDVMRRIATLLGKTVKWSSPDNGAYRLSYADSPARADIHVDQPATESVRHHAGVLYLNLPQQCRGGTTFWRHRPSGWARRPSATQLREQGYASALEFQRRWLKLAGKLPFEALKAGRHDWEPLLEVPMRFNRLVVYRSDFFHSISDVFGSRPDDGRLVQLFFFETVA